MVSIEYGESEIMMTVAELAKRCNLTTQSIYDALEKKKLNAVKVGKHFMISKAEALKWRKNLYSRKNSEHNGEKVFKEGYMSVNEVAKYLKVPLSRVYYLLYCKGKRLKSEKLGGSIRVKSEDLIEHVAKHKGCKLLRRKKGRNLK